jgi:hypothetical protein
MQVYRYTGIQVFKCEKFREELIVYFLLLRHGPHRKQRLQHFFVAGGMSLESCYIATTRGYSDTPIDTRPTILLLLRVLPRERCLATKGEIQFTEPLPSNDRRDTHTDTQTGGRNL